MPVQLASPNLWVNQSVTSLLPQIVNSGMGAQRHIQALDRGVFEHG